MIDPDHLLGLEIPSVTASHSIRDTMLYALGLGLGANPCDPWELSFVTESGLKAVPTMSLVLALNGNWMTDLDTGITYSGVVDGERAIHFHNPVPINGEVTAKTRVIDVIDKGAGRGALIKVERILSAADGTLVATTHQTVFARADGGFGGAARKTEPSPAMPDRKPDFTCNSPTLPQQALLYRLSGDYNPLHANPEVARRAGFQRPILHGLATFGIAAVNVIRSAIDGDPTRLRSIGGRFTAPVYPGTPLSTEIWIEGDAAQFRVLNAETGMPVMSNCHAQLG